jgi:hypothetical protein
VRYARDPAATTAAGLRRSIQGRRQDCFVDDLFATEFLAAVFCAVVLVAVDFAVGLLAVVFLTGALAAVFFTVVFLATGFFTVSVVAAADGADEVSATTA